MLKNVFIFLWKLGSLFFGLFVISFFNSFF